MSNRDKVIEQARKTIASLPKWQVKELKQNYDRADEEARRILRGKPGDQ